MIKKLISLTLILSMLSLVLAGCGGGGADTPAGDTNDSEQTYSFELAMDSPEDTVTYLFGKKFADLVDEKSNGRIKITVYSSGQLGGDREICESVQKGDIAFVVQNTAPQVNFVPELAVFDLPNLFPNAEVARKVLDGPFFDTIAEKYEENNIKLLGYADQGFRVMTTNKKVETIEDFNGQKIRTMENPYHLAYWEALGANPTPMAFAEVYLGLQQGTIDAQENPYEVIVANRFYEIQKYVVNTNHLIHLISLITNVQLFNDLSEQDQQIILEAAEEAKVWAREQADLRVEDRVNTIVENGAEIVDISDELREEMIKRSESVYEEIRNAIGDELVDAALKAVEEVQ
ncbi:MAG: TRAP transporter substrate-binding protein [Tissierellia bacterium]|nr:TRAP transporter substrate-binding protein [Tissierellia bacterium]